MNIDLYRKHLNSQEFERKLNERLERLQRAEVNPVERTSIILEMQNDPILFIKLFGVVYEPRLGDMTDVPFFPWAYQEEVIYKTIESETRGEDVLIEKTRDMGITWTFIWYFLWRWLTKDNWYCLMGSRKEEEVDNKSPQSLFGKLRYAYYSMPQWARPQSFRKSEHDIFMKFVNPDKRSYIDGESANPNFARGKRTSIVYMDELFFWKFARESWRSALDTTNCRIGVSTAKPTSFARNLRDSFEQQGKLITLDRKKHPFKDDEWYKQEEKRRENDTLAIEGEIDISYRVDPENAYYPDVENCPVKQLEYNPSLPLFIGLDFGAQDKTAFSYWQKDAQYYYCIFGTENRNKRLAWYYPFLKKGFDFTEQDSFEIENKFTREKITLHKKEYSKDDIDFIHTFNSWNTPAMYCGEVAHKQKMIKSYTSIAQELAGIGIFLRINDNGMEHKVRRNSTIKMLQKSIFADNDGALSVYDALLNSHYAIGRENTVSETTKDKPIHDEWADLRSSVENLAVNIITQFKGVRSFSYNKKVSRR